MYLIRKLCDGQYFWLVTMLQKWKTNCAFVGAPFHGALFGRTCWTCLNPPLVVCVRILIRATRQTTCRKIVYRIYFSYKNLLSVASLRLVSPAAVTNGVTVFSPQKVMTLLVIVLPVVVYLFQQQQTKHMNNNIIRFTKLRNQKGKCPSCWPPIAQTKW